MTNANEDTAQGFGFDFDLYEGDNSFDPLADFEEVEEDFDDRDICLDIPTAVESGDTAELAPAPKKDERPAEERIAELFVRMNNERNILRGILGFCTTPQPLNQVEVAIEGEMRQHLCVYGVDNFLTKLEAAGAIQKTFENGEPYTWEPGEPEVVVIDGVEYLEEQEAPQIFYSTTEAGAAQLGTDSRKQQMVGFFEREHAYLGIYKRVLTMCAREEGAMMPQMAKYVDNDPLVQKPRFYVAHFVDNMEACDAVKWEGAWKITDIGREALEILAGVQDEICDTL